MKTVISDVNCTYTTEVIAFFDRIAAEHPNAVFYKKNISFTPTECIFARTKNGSSFGQFVRAMFNDGELGTVAVAGVSSASQMKLTQGDEFIVIDI